MTLSLARLASATLVLFYCALGTAHAQSAQAQSNKNDYSDSKNWLCRPGSTSDACAVDLTSTIVNADGKTSVEKWTANPDAPVDCFYVYPTVSNDTTPHSDMNAGPEEKSVVQQQFARFASQCRVYAPLYRQITLTALRALVAGKPAAINPMLGYGDVLDAWNYYLKNDNQGRGVVLIGHSQGSSVLTQLIAQEIDGKPIQKQLVSALLLGWNVAVPKGKDMGGSFKQIPVCQSATQIQCVLAYVSFRATSPPPANTRFGKVAGADMQAICVNPAELEQRELHSYLSATGRNGTGEPTKWLANAAIDTPFVSTPGLLSAQCVNTDGVSYLSVTVNGQPIDPRTDEIYGDVVAEGVIQKDWGLHLIDANVAMGNLIGVVNQQAKAYVASAKDCNCKK
jgi:hypothetical protein